MVAPRFIKIFILKLQELSESTIWLTVTVRMLINIYIFLTVTDRYYYDNVKTRKTDTGV